MNCKIPLTRPSLGFFAATYSRNKRDVIYLLNMLEDSGLVKRMTHDGIGEYRVEPAGHNYSDSLKFTKSASTDGFVAMYFNDELDDIYQNGFASGIKRAGYTPVRIDREEHINRIDDEILARIRSSAFVIADFTGHRGGVYFEAGYALGLGLPVIWTCNEGDMGRTSL